MSIKKHISKVFVATFCLIVVLFSTMTTSPSAIQAAVSLDTADMLSIPIKSYTDAAEKFARVGISAFGIPIPFTSLDSVMKLSVKSIINKMNINVLSWINIGGGTSENPDPLFITDLNVYLNQVGQDAGSKYLTDNRGNFCGYFNGELSDGLATYFDTESYGGGNGSCSFDKYEQQGFFDDFNNGGWSAWISLTQNPNNNVMGAWITHKDAMEVAIQKDQNKAIEEARWGNGMKSEKDASGKIITPGKIISDQLSFVLTSDQRQLENAKSFDDIITTLTQSLITKAISGVNQSGGSGGNGPSRGVASLNRNTVKDTSNQHLAFPGSQISRSSEKDSDKNVSVTGEASGTSNIGFHEPELALTASSYGCNSDTCGYISKEANNPYWEVDLGNVLPITKISVQYLPGDYQLNNFYVCVFDKKGSANYSHECTASPTNAIWQSEKYYDEDGNVKGITINRGVGINDLPKSGINGRYVRIQAQGSEAHLALRSVEVFAEVVPEIFLIGESTVTVALNSEFVEQGWTAVDENDGDLTKKVEVTGVVNTSKVGTYTLSYDVKNSAGVPAKTVKRTIIVQ